MRKNVIDLEIVDELIESGVSKVSLVEMPAIDIDWMAFKKENFVEPGAKESKDEFVARCIAYNVNEGKPEDQAVAICYSTWESHAIEPNPCWSGFEPYGTKMVNGREVPNCIPVKSAIEPNPCWSGFEPYGTKILNGREVPNCVPVKNNKENFEFDPNLPAYVDEVGKKKEKFAESYTDYPDAAVENAKRALKWAEENGWGDCGMGAGKARANQLANREPISEDTIARMASFERHRQNSETPYGRGCGKLMWDAWGGSEGVEWASRKLKQIRENFAIQGIPLPRGQKVILQAEDEDYDRGLIVELKEEGGYDIQYWFQTPDNIEPSEIKVDGEIVTPSGTTVYMGFHPELYEKVTLTKQFFASEDQQILVGPAMIPDTDILRKEEKTGKPYYVRFSKDVISRIAEKFMRELRNDQTNIEHKDNNAGSYVMESWIVESEDDKLNSVYGFNVPVGSWAIKMRVQDPKTWKMIKEGKLNGFSIEGAFMTKEDYEQYRKDRSVYEKVMKILKSI